MRPERAGPLALLAALVCFGAGGMAEAAQVLRVGNPGKPASLDPHRITGVWENRIVGDMFVGLVTEGPDGALEPGAASDWSVSPDGRIWTFRIREHEWSDGTPVTAHDFVYSFRRMLAPATACAYADFFFMIRGAQEIAQGREPDAFGVRALDDLTLEIRLNQPTAYFAGLLTHFAAMPVPRHVVETRGKDWVEAGEIVVNGPFVLSERVPNAFVRLIRNPRFYAAEDVALDGVTYYVQEDRDALVSRFRAGELDLVHDFPSAKAAWLRQRLGPGVRTGPRLGLTFIAVNHARAALADARVRAALAMSLDRRTITTKLLGSGEQVAHSLVPPGIANYEAPPRYGWADDPMPQRLAAARSLMAEAGYGPDRPLRLELRLRLSENDRRVAVAAQSMWREVFVETELMRAETAVHYAQLQAGEFDLGLASWLAVWSDPQTFTLLLESRTGANNFGRFADGEYDQLTAAAAREPDLERRAGLLRRAEALALKANGLIPVYHHAARNLVGSAVAGWQDNVLDVHRSRYLSLSE